MSETIGPIAVAADVDVIILSWNRVDDTLAAISSAVAQQDVRPAVLVLDQGTEANGLRRLRAFIEPLQNVHLRELGHNIGVAGGRNEATAMGRSPFVVALDSDAIFAHQWVLKRVVEELRQRPDLGAVAFRITNFFTRRNDETSWDYPAQCDPAARFQCSRFIGAGHAVRRDLFERLGGYDEKLFFCGEELDLCYRILNCGYAIEYVPEAEILHKVAPEQRVFWNKGRFFYTVRNNLYTSFKMRVPISRLVVAAVSFLVKGGYNGVAYDALRGIREAIGLCRQFRRDAPENASYRIEEKTWGRIRELEPWRADRLNDKIRRQFRQLPHQA